MSQNNEKKKVAVYTVLRVNEMTHPPLYTRSAPEGDVLKTGSDLNDLSNDVVSFFQQEYSDVDTYDEWLALVSTAVHDIVIADACVGEIFRGSILIEDDTRKAFELTKKYHREQTRKGGGAQYIIHIMMIARLLWALYQRGQIDRATLLAGICHDLLEDTACPEEEIIEVCGQEVLEIVKAVSNDPTLEDKAQWELKKEDYIKSVEAGGSKAMTVALCDKMVNMQSLFAQYDIEGSGVWSHFNRGKAKKLWFEKNVLSMLQKHLTTPVLGEYEKMITKLSGLEEEKTDPKDA